MDQPLPLQYLSWLGRFVIGDCGVSFSTGQAIRPLVLERLGNSLMLAGLTMLLAVPLSVGLGVVAALKQDKAADKSAVEATVARLGADGVIVTRLLDKKTFDTYYPPQVAYVPYRGYYGGWSNYYYGSYTAVTTAGYTLQQQVVVLETNLYATKEEKLVWSGVSETFVEDSAEQLVRTLVGMIVKDLASKGLI